MKLIFGLQVHYRFCPLFIQNGFNQKDAIGKRKVEQRYGVPAYGVVQFMSTKNTILKKYDGRFKDIFQEIYET